jgi:hypothetical protein
MATDILRTEIEQLIGDQINLPSPPTIAAQILNAYSIDSGHSFQSKAATDST